MDGDKPIYIHPSLSSGFVLSVKIWIPPEKISEFFALFKPVYDAVIAEEECRFFVVTQNEQEPGCISWVEGWTKDVNWLMSEQLPKSYYQPYLKETEAMFTKPRFFEILKPEASFGHFKVPKT
ncbi:uncharacterized protein Z518_10599 [Rhinocladiella mackenziei CBS 650.93]|uniref:ABM domain-containing protein n=1 Tax=Rhinocladiella mackenziei CBS 650.93 TaxID=1442369 RepID=A0A0D2I3W5_9EURO|nr:uncharacterized protein Z518_10599 [Rhinocladiella mackenziei CBS 650.93]KIX00459.1 hypothetical protein Z518_10599 [Rhinocladiella mackenziei CBS 650.93]